MNVIAQKIRLSPMLLRVAPFAIFLLLTFAQNHFGEQGRYWFYLAKTLLGAWMIWLVRPYVAEMRWNVSVAAIIAGIAVFLVWIGLDQLFREWGFAQAPRQKTALGAWNPIAQFGSGSLLAGFFIFVRVAGSTLVVPPLEEVFFRSWLYRYLVRHNIETVEMGRFYWLPFFITSIIFGLEHREWVAGILCGFAFQGLVCWKKRLGDAITAHAITNFLLSLWVVWKGAWQFW